MLDTHGRAMVQPIISKTARIFLTIGLKANHVTILAFLIGILACVLVYLKQPIAGVIVFWLSGFLDAWWTGVWQDKAKHLLRGELY